MRRLDAFVLLRTTRAAQRGAALVVGLVLLLVLTILGISTLRTASMELLMAGNTQFKDNAFQLAESGIENQLAQIASGAVGLLPIDNWQQTVGPLPIAELNGDYSITNRYLNDGTLSTCGSVGVFSAYHFEVEADGDAERDAESTQSQGLFLCGPAGL